MEEVYKNIIREIQQGITPVSRPYQEMASRIGISEDEFLLRMKELLSSGVVRKIGALVYHRRIGFTANALCVWKVPSHELERIGELFAEFPFVTHCYERCTYPHWSYNLYTMIHATSKRGCEDYIAQMCTQSGMDEYRIFYSTRELKKTSMRYYECTCCAKKIDRDVSDYV